MGEKDPGSLGITRRGLIFDVLKPLVITAAGGAVMAVGGYVLGDLGESPAQIIQKQITEPRRKLVNKFSASLQRWVNPELDPGFWSILPSLAELDDETFQRTLRFVPNPQGGEYRFKRYPFSTPEGSAALNAGSPDIILSAASGVFVFNPNGTFNLRSRGLRPMVSQSELLPLAQEIYRSKSPIDWKTYDAGKGKPSDPIVGTSLEGGSTITRSLSTELLGEVTVVAA